MSDVTERLEYNAAVSAAAYQDELVRPSYLYRPKLSIDGDKWCALYGENIQDGVVGFGPSPDSAYRAFDLAWYENLPQDKEGEEE